VRGFAVFAEKRTTAGVAVALEIWKLIIMS